LVASKKFPVVYVVSSQDLSQFLQFLGSPTQLRKLTKETEIFFNTMKCKSICRRCKLTVKTLLIFVFTLNIGLSGCAGRKNAQALSDALIEGTKLHQSFDEKIYSNYVSSLRKQMDLISKEKRAKVEALRQKFIADGCEKFNDVFRDSIQKFDQDLTATEKVTFDSAQQKIIDAIDNLKKSPSDANRQALAGAVTKFRLLVDQDSTSRSKVIGAVIQERANSLQLWNEKVNNAFDDALKDFGEAENQSSAALQQLTDSMAKLEDQYKAVLAGQQQLNEYLKQKSAVRLALEGALRGVGLNVSLPSIDSFGEAMVGQLENRLNNGVDRFTKKLEQPQRR
jgi:hypothetical protein